MTKSDSAVPTSCRHGVEFGSNGCQSQPRSSSRRPHQRVKQAEQFLVAAMVCLMSACGGDDSAAPIALAPGPNTPATPSAPTATSAIPPCIDGYGTAANRAAIEQAMLNGTAADVRAALATARLTRDIRLGCPEIDVVRSSPNTTSPTLSQLTAHWNRVHAPAVARFQIKCPEIGRSSPSAALGAWLAKRAGAAASAVALADIARMVEAQQFTAERAAPVVDTTYGIFGGVVSNGLTDSCALGGVPGEQVSEWCARFPAQCPIYASGLFAGRRFLVADINRAAGVIDGGAGFDQGWAGVMMIEAAIGEADPTLRARFNATARLAGTWSASEPPVRNHNYTAKNIWLLARLYAWSGETAYRTAMFDKLERNLLLGVLLDENGDGFSDAPGPLIAFANLAPVAQTPGRMWDAHNSVTHYQAMNTVAMVEAYVALRDRGDVADAARVRPYALAMLDNLAQEFTVLGVPETGASQREAGVALALGQWKIAGVEGLMRPAWEQSLAAIYNAGASSEAGAGTIFAGVYLAARSAIPY